MLYIVVMLLLVVLPVITASTMILHGGLDLLLLSIAKVVRLVLVSILVSCLLAACTGPGHVPHRRDISTVSSHAVDPQLPVLLQYSLKPLEGQQDWCSWPHVHLLSLCSKLLNMVQPPEALISH